MGFKIIEEMEKMAGELVPLDDESVYKISETTKSKPT